VAQSAIRGEGWGGESDLGHLTDSELVAAALDGRQGAFEALFDRYGRRRVLLPLLALPAAIEPHLAAHLAHFVTTAGTAAGSAVDSAGAGAAATAGEVAATGAGVGGLGVGGLGAISLGAKVAALVGTKAAIVAVGVATAGVVGTTVVLRAHHSTPAPHRMIQNRQGGAGQITPTPPQTSPTGPRCQGATGGSTAPPGVPSGTVATGQPTKGQSVITATA